MSTTLVNSSPAGTRYGVVVALHDGFYGARSGSGFSNRAFLAAVARLLPDGQLTVIPVRESSASEDLHWSGELRRVLQRVGAKVVPVHHERVDSVHDCELLCKQVAEEVRRIADGLDRCLLVGLDQPLLGLSRYVAGSVRLLLVPRSTAALTRPGDEFRIGWERDGIQAAARSGHIAAISQFMREHLRLEYGVPDHAMVDIPNGLLSGGEFISESNTAPLPAPAKAGFLLALGRAVPSKGFEDLLAGLQLLRAQPARLPHLILAATTSSGLNEHQRQLAHMIRAGGLEATLITTFNPTIRGWMRSPALRAIVVPSRQEPFGRIPLEAFAAGAGPVVATHAGGLRETVIDGQTGFTAAPGDPASLAAAIQRALAAPPHERKRLACAGAVLLRERHDYLSAIRAALTGIAPWAIAPPTGGDVR